MGKSGVICENCTGLLTKVFGDNNENIDNGFIG